MIYTTGYQRMPDSAYLLRLCDMLGVTRLLDCRSVPVTRKPGFGPRQLETLLGVRYRAAGRDIGGRRQNTPPLTMPPKSDAAFYGMIDFLAENQDGERLMLMCMEEAPNECHRHHTIGLPLARRGCKVLHVFQGEVIDALELERAVAAGDDYDFEDLDDHARRVKR